MQSLRVKILTVVVAMVLIGGVVDAKWDILSKDLATVLMGVHFTDAQHGWVAGANNGVGPVILRTENGGQTWTNQVTSLQVFTYLDIDIGPDQLHGVAGGLGAFFQFVGSSWTLDGGKNWRKSTEIGLAEAYQDVQVTSARINFLFGEWDAEIVGGSGTGVAISQDFGFSYQHHDWKQNTPARYGFFFSASTGILAGGQFPSNNSSAPIRRVLRNADGSTTYTLSRHISYTVSTDETGKKTVSTLVKNEQSAKKSAGDDGFRGVIAITRDGGATWNKTFDQAGKLYFNGIHFVDANNGWVVAEGDGDGEQNAFIFRTSDGGKSWKEQLKTPKGGSLMQIRMFDLNEGWAVGGSFSLGFTANFWHTTDGGANWKLAETKFGYFCTNIHASKNKDVFVTAIGIDGMSSILKYSA